MATFTMLPFMSIFNIPIMGEYRHAVCQSLRCGIQAHFVDSQASTVFLPGVESPSFSLTSMLFSLDTH
jgi:hypothetical protein